MNSMPVSVFISHGGGPLPLLGDKQHLEMNECLRNLAASMPEPEAIVLVSAHWEERVPTVTAAQHPSLIYDYYGFPPESYEIKYPCPGEPSLATELQRLLCKKDFDAELSDNRGLDHGAFVPLKIMYPKANIPCVQVSMIDSLNPDDHIKMGSVMSQLHKENVLLIGSGFSFHNLNAFFKKDPESDRQNTEFENWLQEACGSDQLSENKRREKLVNWESAPGARYCHPREEHLLPLHVCYGAAGGPCTETYRLNIMNKMSSMFRWG